VSHPSAAPPPRRVPPPRTPSGRHPTVVEYRRRLDSIAEHTGQQLNDLGEDIDRVLKEVKTPVPPPPDP